MMKKEKRRKKNSTTFTLVTSGRAYYSLMPWMRKKRKENGMRFVLVKRNEGKFIDDFDGGGKKKKHRYLN